jgi:hypothetical protein
MALLGMALNQRAHRLGVSRWPLAAWASGQTQPLRTGMASLMSTWPIRTSSGSISALTPGMAATQPMLWRAAWRPRRYRQGFGTGTLGLSQELATCVPGVLLHRSGLCCCSVT